MILENWNVWHNRTSYFLEPINLHEAALKMIKANLCKVVYHSDQVVYWGKNSQIFAENSEIEMEGYSRRASINLPENIDGYEIEGLLQASMLRFYELDIFSGFIIQNINYIRGFLEVCILELDDKTIYLYPQIKVYENGVFTIIFRILGCKAPYEIDDLINYEINLFRHNTYSLRVPPQILKLDGTNFLLGNKTKLTKRRECIKYLNGVYKIIDENTHSVDMADFVFNLCPVDPQSALGNPELNIESLWYYISGALTATLSDQKPNISFLIKGQQRPKVNLGGFWSNRPEVYILSFKDQPESAEAVEYSYGDDIIKLLVRATEIPRVDIKKDIIKNLRVFNDMLTYVHEGGGVHIMSRSGLNIDNPWEDRNNGHLIYPHQAKAELINYIYLTFHRLHELTLSPVSKFSIINKYKKLLFLQNDLLRNVSMYGEINDYCNEAWGLLKVQETITSIEKNIDMKIDNLKTMQNDKFVKFGWVLAIIFGIVGVSNLSQQVIHPLWKTIGLPIPVNSDFFDAFVWALTAILVLIIVLFSYAAIHRKYRV